MKTTADQNKSEAIEHVRQSIKLLAAIVVDECDGGI